MSEFIEQSMRTLKLGGMAREWRSVQYENTEQYVTDLLRLELREREANRINRMVKTAGFRVMKTLQDHGYRTIPVNPQITGEHVHGEFVWRDLSQIGDPIDMVEIFRNSAAAGEAVDQAIAAGAKAVWMQLGVVNAEAAARAEAAGLKVVMDRCPMMEIPRLGVPPVGEA